MYIKGYINIRKYYLLFQYFPFQVFQQPSPVCYGSNGSSFHEATNLSSVDTNEIRVNMHTTPMTLTCTHGHTNFLEVLHGYTEEPALPLMIYSQLKHLIHT